MHGRQIVLGNHFWSGTKLWDPEGVLSTIPAIGSAMLGIFTGNLLRSEKDPTTKTVWFMFRQRSNGCWVGLEFLVST